MQDLQIKLIGAGLVVVLAIIFVIWVSNLPAVEPREEVDPRLVFVVECTKSSGIGLAMRPVCGCIYDNVQAGVPVSDELSEQCLRQESDLLD